MNRGTDAELLRRAAEERLRRENEKRGVRGEDLDELLELMKLGETIAKLDLNKVAEERLARMSEKTRVVHELVSQSKDIDRRLKLLKKPKKRKKQHWKTREKKRRDYDKNVRTPRARERKARILDEKGWYPILREQWIRMGLDVQLTVEEWDEHIATVLGDRTPNIRRYNPSGPISLGNITVLAGKSTVFDGMEYSLKALGYAL